jgi:23S rRNA (cytosine1962-C5)-methyltransferase
MDRKVVLKPEKEKSLERRHPWIFSGAIASRPEHDEGEILPIYSHAGTFLAQGYFHTQNSIAGRLLSFEEAPIHQAIYKRIAQAINLRKELFDPSMTNGYRLINAEGDGLPGLVVDKYDQILVVQISTWGMERLKPFLIETLKEIMAPLAIYEKSTSFARKQEGLEAHEGWLLGLGEPEVKIRENGLSFIASIEKGQKTGFFFDQREMRQLVMRLAMNKRVLNTFAYSGGFSLFALKGGANRVDSVDISEEASSLARKNTLLNGMDLQRHQILTQDAFLFLKDSPLDYDLVILDPPAFAKKREDVKNACQGYKELHRLVFHKLRPGTVLLTSSCSSYIDASLFQNIVSQAACEEGRTIQILGRHHLAVDHPLNPAHLEGDYLKSQLLYVSE